jgi:hypothetical protein
MENAGNGDEEEVLIHVWSSWLQVMCEMSHPTGRNLETPTRGCYLRIRNGQPVGFPEIGLCFLCLHQKLLGTPQAILVKVCPGGDA